MPLFINIGQSTESNRDPAVVSVIWTVMNKFFAKSVHKSAFEDAAKTDSTNFWAQPKFYERRGGVSNQRFQLQRFCGHICEHRSWSLLIRITKNEELMPNSGQDSWWFRTSLAKKELDSSFHENRRYEKYHQGERKRRHGSQHHHRSPSHFAFKSSESVIGLNMLVSINGHYHTAIDYCLYCLNHRSERFADYVASKMANIHKTVAFQKQFYWKRS